MIFNNELSTIQQKMAASAAGVERRLEILKALNLVTGQTVLDIGCGGGHLLEDLALAVGEKGKIFGLDPSETQIEAAIKRCNKLNNVKLLQLPANETGLKDNSVDIATSTQTLEYIKDVDDALIEIARVIKSQAKFVNVSILWDHFKFHGPENSLNQLIHDAFKDHCHHQMLPMELNMRLTRKGFENITSRGLPFLITKRHENSPAKFSEEVLARFALSKGVSEDKVFEWRRQLTMAEKDGRFGFTSYPVLTEANLK
ncbi:MAG: methyltransferase domain-containing protein [Paracoccaceae bacterium]|nr:methyltransferase domain-containing protein [Paracoccaceae bacterium]